MCSNMNIALFFASRQLIRKRYSLVQWSKGVMSIAACTVKLSSNLCFDFDPKLKSTCRMQYRTNFQNKRIDLQKTLIGKVVERCHINCSTESEVNRIKQAVLSATKFSDRFCLEVEEHLPKNQRKEGARKANPTSRTGKTLQKRVRKLDPKHTRPENQE
jgi:hypothetical protein